MKPLIILTGPTAVGKTKLSIALANAVNGEIISADSMQVYKRMDIGTAKITKEEMQGVRHYLIDEFDPADEFNVVKFQEYAKRYMDEIYAKGKVPILVGGTGFYIQAVTKDVDFTKEEQDTTYRKELEALAGEKGADYLHQMLVAVDEKAAESIHANNVKRVIRALEYHKLTGNKISEHNEEQSHKQSPYNYCYFVLNDDRNKLYERIDARVDLMIEQGLEQEVRALMEEGLSRELVSMQGLGYKEMAAYIDGECSLEEAVYIIKRDTRHFAKRQLTWFKRESDVIWVNKPDFDYDDNKLLDYMLDQIKQKR